MENIQKRSWDDDEEAMKLFKQGGLVQNTEKSRENWGKRFKEYLTVKNLSLENMTDKSTLATHLERFYYGLKKKNGKSYEVSSIRTSIGPLSKYLSDNIPNLGAGVSVVSIYQDNEFVDVRKMLNAVCKEGAKQGLDVGKGKSIISHEQEILLVEHFDTQTPLGLLERVLYIVSKYGLLRGNGCHGFMRSWVKELPQNNNLQRSFEFILPAEKNNQRNLSKQGGARTYQIPYENEEDNNAFAFYLSKIPSTYDTKDLFLRPASEIQSTNFGYWYHDKPASKKMVTEFIQRAAKELDFGDGDGSKYTGHSIRASGITHLAAIGVQDTDLMNVSGHRTSAGLIHYKKNEGQKYQHLVKFKLPSASGSKQSFQAKQVLQPSASQNIDYRPFKKPMLNKPLPTVSKPSPTVSFPHKKQVNLPFKPLTFRRKL